MGIALALIYVVGAAMTAGLGSFFAYAGQEFGLTEPARIAALWMALLSLVWPATLLLALWWLSRQLLRGALR